MLRDDTIFHSEEGARRNNSNVQAPERNKTIHQYLFRSAKEFNVVYAFSLDLIGNAL